MHMHAATWGHVGLDGDSPTPEMEAAEEAGEMAMLRARYGRKIMHARVSLCGLLPDTEALIMNPGTLQDLADIFETDIAQAFA